MECNVVTVWSSFNRDTSLFKNKKTRRYQEYNFLSILDNLSEGIFSQRLVVSFVGVCLLLTYIKYYTRDHDTAVLHLGFVASGFTIAVYGSPLVSVANVIRHKSTEFMTFSMSLAGFVVSSLWTIYGHLVQDKFITVPNGIGVILGSVQLLLFVIYPSTAQRTITYDMKSPKPV